MIDTGKFWKLCGSSVEVKYGEKLSDLKSKIHKNLMAPCELVITIFLMMGIFA